MMSTRCYLLLAILLMTLMVTAHPMPHSVLILDVREDGISAQLSLPLKEFQIVFPEEDLDNGYLTLIDKKDKWLDDYLLKHFSITDPNGEQWTITVKGKSVSENEQSFTGKYHELTFRLWMQAPANSSPRHFVMHYDVIMHQLVTHKLFIRIARDWYSGMTAKDSADADLGVLMVNTGNGTIPPVVVDLDEGSAWKGFKTMVELGIDHIAEGSDHLLFLLVLLLPSALIVERKRWTKFGGMKYSLIRLIKIATAFTIGHSISLIFGAMKWLTLPQQPVEIAIAITILITAIHAVKPFFYGKEVYIAIGFGLIHGLAFSNILSEMDLDGRQLAYSILGFNLGIELMQLFVILSTMPWLIVLSKNKVYKWLRITGALLAIAASTGWIVERIAGHSNPLSLLVQQTAEEGKWFVAILAVLAIISMIFSKNKVTAG